jgi:hypothetical protein
MLLLNLSSPKRTLMKTTHILFTVAVTSAFGACSQEALSPLEPTVAYNKLTKKASTYPHNFALVTRYAQLKILLT